MINCNLRFVASIAKKYSFSADMFQDLFQAGVAGLIRAIDHFDETRGFRFSTFAVHYIRDEILRECNNTNSVLCIPNNAYYEIRKQKKATSKLKEEFGRNPSYEEIAEATGKSIETVINFAAAIPETVSLDATIGEDEEAEEYSEVIPDATAISPEDAAVDNVASSEMMKALGKLSEKEREVVCARFGIGCDECTIDELSRKYHISREGIRILEMRALRRMRSMLSTGAYAA